MSFHCETPYELDERDKTFLARLGRMIRESTLGFVAGGQFIDERFSLASVASSHGSRNGQLRRGDALPSPQERLVAALRWAVEPTAGARDDERQAICLLAWLVTDPSAHDLSTVLCDFQMIPWKPASADGHDANIARSLWGSREAAAIEGFDLRLIQAARRSAEGLDVKLSGRA
jgi:hypothetical protein